MTGKWLLAFCFLFCTASSCTLRDDKEKLNLIENNIGQKFKLSNIVDTAGNLIDLDFTKSDINIIDIWNSHCPPCINDMKQFPLLIKGYNNKVSVYSVSLDQFWIWKTILSEHKGRFSFLTDSTSNWRQYNLMTTDNPRFRNDLSFDRLKELDSLYGMKGNPAYFVIDRTGKIIARPRSAVAYLNAYL